MGKQLLQSSFLSSVLSAVSHDVSLIVGCVVCSVQYLHLLNIHSCSEDPVKWDSFVILILFEIIYF